MKKNKVTKAIAIPDNVPNPQCAGLDTILELTKKEPKLLAIATLRAEQVNTNNLGVIRKLFASKKAHGFKIFPGHDPIYPTDKRWQPIFSLCQEFNLPLIIHTGINTGDKKCAKYNDPAHIVNVANSFKNLKIIIAHYFWPKLDYCFKITKGYKNIFFDTSCLADEEVLKMSKGLRKIKKILIKTISRDRHSLIFGSDWPMTDMAAHINLIKTLPVADSLKDDIYFRNAIRVFKLKK
ncbi:hypothetical protein C4569_03020 [Candidatus Parcubacteria bacterium]|nr:MAG: hypothetical protein C4569_03020 [Candidatus Parcubacteria bacterium]